MTWRPLKLLLIAPFAALMLTISTPVEAKDRAHARDDRIEYRYDRQDRHHGHKVGHGRRDRYEHHGHRRHYQPSIQFRWYLH